MKVAIYGRVSTRDQEVRNQVAELQRAAVEKGWEIVGQYLDVGVKGDEVKPELERLLRDAHVGRIDRVIFWSLDRLTRKGPLDALSTLDRLAQQGMGYWSYKEPYLDTTLPFHESFTAFMADIARFEKRRLVERIKAGIAEKRAEAAKDGKPFLWGQARRSRLLMNPALPSRVAALRAQGSSWTRIAATLELPVGTCRRYYRYALGDGRPCLLDDVAERKASRRRPKDE